MHKKPLAEVLRPTTLDEVVGQEHLVGKDGVLRKLLGKGFLPSIIFWGPPGSGKTTLAYVLAKEASKDFFVLNAVEAGVKEVKEVIKFAENGRDVLLFIDEIHRFNKAQQDYLLKAVERGIITLIGATTENPSFSIISPLLSRCQVYVLRELGLREMQQLFKRAKLYYEQQGITLLTRDEMSLYYYAAGDARKLYNILELLVETSDSNNVDVSEPSIRAVLQKKFARYDKTDDQHYDTISAFIKSVRGSDPHAALYWLARMLVAGEDPVFIARRLVILAAEDVGLANPNALLLANATFDVVQKIGMPEARIPLAQCTIYLASSPKSNSAYVAIEKAMKLAEDTSELPVPFHLRNAPTSLMQKLGYGKEYLYPHDFERHFILQEYFPQELSGTIIYQPADNSRERELINYLISCWKDKYNL